jgi:arginine deiminase
MAYYIDNTKRFKDAVAIYNNNLENFSFNVSYMVKGFNREHFKVRQELIRQKIPIEKLDELAKEYVGAE